MRKTNIIKMYCHNCLTGEAHINITTCPICGMGLSEKKPSKFRRWFGYRPINDSYRDRVTDWLIEKGLLKADENARWLTKEEVDAAFPLDDDEPRCSKCSKSIRYERAHEDGLCEECAVKKFNGE